MATTQMNVRIDCDVKPAGDAALASIGFTPSSVIQAVWRFAERNKRNRKELLRLKAVLESAEQSASDEEDAKSWVVAGPAIYADMLAEMGIEGDPQPLEESTEDLLFQAYQDKLEERGLR